VYSLFSNAKYKRLFFVHLSHQEMNYTEGLHPIHTTPHSWINMDLDNTDNQPMQGEALTPHDRRQLHLQRQRERRQRQKRHQQYIQSLLPPARLPCLPLCSDETGPTSIIKPHLTLPEDQPPRLLQKEIIFGPLLHHVYQKIRRGEGPCYTCMSHQKCSNHVE